LRIIHIIIFSHSHPCAIVFITHVPPAWGPDEQVHIGRAYQISYGRLYPTAINKQGRFGGKVPSSLIKSIDYESIIAFEASDDGYFYDRQDISNMKKSRSISEQPLNDNKKTNYTFGSTGPYSPAGYAPASIGFWLAARFNTSVDTAVELARILQASFFCTLIFISLKILKKHKLRWMVFVIALLPSTIYHAAVISADAFTSSIALLFFSAVSLYLLEDRKQNKATSYLLAVSLLFLAMSKPSYFLLAPLVLFIPTKKLSNVKRPILFKISIITVAVAVFLIVSAIGSKYSSVIVQSAIPSTRLPVGVKGQFLWIVKNPPAMITVLAQTFNEMTKDWHQSIVGMLGLNFVPTPYPFVILASLNLAMVSLYARVKNNKINMLYSVAGAAAFFAVIVLLYLTFNGVGSEVVYGVQGRYFIPTLPFLLISAAGFTPFSVQVSKRNAALWFSLTSALVLYFTLIIYMFALY
jgi:uncharacterized membrane protein